MIATRAVLAVLVVGLASGAWARSEPTTRQQQETACYNDAVTLCAEYIPDEARITACMERKRAQLSPACAAMFNEGGAGK